MQHQKGQLRNIYVCILLQLPWHIIMYNTYANSYMIGTIISLATCMQVSFQFPISYYILQHECSLFVLYCENILWLSFSQCLLQKCNAFRTSNHRVYFVHGATLKLTILIIVRTRQILNVLDHTAFKIIAYTSFKEYSIIKKFYLPELKLNKICKQIEFTICIFIVGCDK